MIEDTVFELKDARVALNSTIVLNGLDFRLDTGEFLALLGSNGSGKTTLVRALLGLVPLAGGTVTLFGEPIGRFREWSRIGYVPQRITLGSGAPASVMEIALSGRVGRARRFRPYGDEDRSAARQALETVGLADLAAAPLAELSSGQQQRALIARALAAEPDVLVMDEPVSGVDVDHQERLAESLKVFNARGGTVLLVAHGLGPVEQLITREVEMHAGKVTYDGPHHAHHVHPDAAHHPEAQVEHSPLDRAVGGS